MTTNIIRCDGNFIISEPTNYQGFIYDCSKNICIPTGHRTPLKWDALKDIFPGLVFEKSFMDIGSNFGFFGFKALEHKCKNVIAIESFKDYYQPISDAVKHQNINNFQWVLGNFPKILEVIPLEADVVMGLSLIHHMSPKYSLGKIVEELSKITKNNLIVEWIDREDDMVKKHGYLDKHPEYNRKNFEDELSKMFKKWNYIGNGHHLTRFIYTANK